MTLMPAVALAALSALVAIPALSQARLFAAAPEHFARVTIASGDNLWTIADRYTPSGQDVQETVDRIIAVNGLTSAAVHPGERLKIPR
ncbi:MAG: LysM peptidoglycan-binding domain-containing protein [Candidatus Eremiobacteraeota bacterium]|nr:LysM peptidoglycan-binding domain-containing protein [Candidatus Eremiobacteraeota bacterium]